MSAAKGGNEAQRIECKIKHTIINTVLVSTALCYAQVTMVSKCAMSIWLGHRASNRFVFGARSVYSSRPLSVND